MYASTSCSASSMMASFGTLGRILVGDGAPLGTGGLGRLLCEGGGDEGRDSVQIGSDSEVPTSVPSTSRRLSVLTPTALMTATETMRPPRRTFR